MSNNSNSIIKTIISGSAWSFIGVLIAVAFFYWQEYRNPFDFRIELVDEFNLVEVKGKLSDLKILYKNDDILESQREIKVVRINLNNAGKTILQSYYDQLEPFGLRFFKSKILDAEVTSSNSEDLKEKLIESFSSTDNTEYDDLILSKVIFDQDDFAALKVTLLQSAKDDLIISPLGKLANIKSLKVSKIKEEVREPVSPWFYIVGGYFGFLIFLIGIIGIIEFSEKRNKNKKIKKFKEKYRPLNETEEEIVNLYLKLSHRTENLISGLVAKDYVLDFKDIIKEQEPSGILQLIMPFSYRHKIRYKRLPKEIFSVQGTSVSFNADNTEFIKSFFTEVL